MAYKSLLIDRIHVLRWGNPTLGDVKAIWSEIEAAHKRLKVPLLCVAIVPTNITPPDSETRVHINKMMPKLIEVSESVQYVMEGTGFKNSIMRSVITSFLIVTGKRGHVTIHSSAEEAIQALGPRMRELGLQMAAVLADLRRSGLLLPTLSMGREAPAGSPGR